jgi:hypothetical protein
MEIDANNDYTKPNEYPYGPPMLDSTLYGRARVQFVRKVYAILACISTFLCSSAAHHCRYDMRINVFAVIQQLSG